MLFSYSSEVDESLFQAYHGLFVKFFGKGRWRVLADTERLA
ncbi:hypothetical protein [Burkholderia gladioli]|nr:hypothetical protein [Burkholderia gladioli]